MGKTVRSAPSYEKDDLYELWLRFRGDHDAAGTLSDFMNGTKEEAQKLIAEFEMVCVAQGLQYGGRPHI